MKLCAIILLLFMQWSRNISGQELDPLLTLQASPVEDYDPLERLLQSSQKAVTNCDDLYNEGIREDGDYLIVANGTTVNVRCEFNNPRGGQHWLIIQRRYNGSVGFYRNWHDYKKGFGSLDGELWLGLDNLHQITSSGSYMLRVFVEDFVNATRVYEYSKFSVGNPKSNYTLTISGFIGNRSYKREDSFEYSNGAQFSTEDSDHDNWNANCGRARHSGWWHKKCSFVNPNGEYILGGKKDATGIYIYRWKRNTYSMKRFEMKIRPYTTGN